MLNLPKKVLIVDNDEMSCNHFENLLKAQQVIVVKANTWENALYLFNSERFELAVVALKLENMSGTTLIQKWRNHDMLHKREIPMALVAPLEVSAGDQALITEIGGLGVLHKPYEQRKLLDAISKTVVAQEKRNSVDENVNTIIWPLIKKDKLDKVKTLTYNLEQEGEYGKYQSALIHASIGEEQHAIDLLLNLSTQDPKNMSYLNELGSIYMRSGKLKEAEETFNKANDMAPGNIDRLTKMAETYLKLTKPDESVECYKELIELSPETPEAKFEMYDKLMEAGFADQAKGFFSETSTPKELVRHYNNRGVLKAKGSDYEEAISEYKSAIRLIPGNKELHKIYYNMGIAFFNSRDFDKSREMFEQSLKLKPDYDKALEKLALVEKALEKKSA